MKSEQANWEYGVDGFVNAKEAAKLVTELSGFEFSYNSMMSYLDELEKTPEGERRNSRTFPLRAGRIPGMSGKSGSPWMICKRSLVEFAKRRRPVEV